jgi:hypothetical protein
MTFRLRDFETSEVRRTLDSHPILGTAHRYGPRWVAPPSNGLDYSIKSVSAIRQLQNERTNTSQNTTLRLSVARRLLGWPDFATASLKAVESKPGRYVKLLGGEGADYKLLVGKDSVMAMENRFMKQASLVQLLAEVQSLITSSTPADGG